MAGSIRQRGKSSWELRVFAGYEPGTGRRLYVTRTVRGTRKEAERELARLVVQVEDGQVSAGAGTVAELFERWFDQNEPGWSPRTAYGYRLLLRRHILPRFGDLPLRKLRAVDLDAWYAELRRHGGEGGKPLSAATVKRIHGLLHVALKQGVRWGWIASNPADNATPPRAARHEITLPEPGDVVRLVEASAEVNYALPYFFRLAAVTGARRGELCALRWRHVDSGRRQLAIVRALVQLPAQVIEKDTKTHQSRRIGLDARTLALLEELRAHQQKRAEPFGVVPGDDAFLFSHEIDGSAPWRPDYATLAFGRLAKELELPGVRLHDLRHFAATLMLVGGQDIRTISGRLGHANAATTLGIYAHFTDAADHQAAEMMGNLLDGRGAGEGSPEAKA